MPWWCEVVVVRRGPLRDLLRPRRGEPPAGGAEGLLRHGGRRPLVLLLPPRTSPWTSWRRRCRPATPMPMSAPSEMMERDVYTDWTLGMLRVREVSERVCGGARGERRSAPVQARPKNRVEGVLCVFSQRRQMTFSREMRGSADAPRRLGERPRAANARERRVTSDANTSGPLERRRDARTRDPARPPSTRTWS